MPGELARDAGLSADEDLNRIMRSVIDKLAELSGRFKRLTDLDRMFGFLLDLKFQEIDSESLQ